jgi:hypothetical protein
MQQAPHVPDQSSSGTRRRMDGIRMRPSGPLFGVSTSQPAARMAADDASNQPLKRDIRRRALYAVTIKRHTRRAASRVNADSSIVATRKPRRRVFAVISPSPTASNFFPMIPFDATPPRHRCRRSRSPTTISNQGRHVGTRRTFAVRSCAAARLALNCRKRFVVLTARFSGARIGVR